MWATITFLCSNIFALHGSEKMWKIPRFFKLLNNIWIDGLCKKTLMISILLHGKLLVQRPRFPARITEMENTEICSSLLMLTQFFFVRTKFIRKAKLKLVNIIYIPFSSLLLFSFLFFFLFFCPFLLNLWPERQLLPLFYCSFSGLVENISENWN